MKINYYLKNGNNMVTTNGFVNYVSIFSKCYSFLL